MLISEFDAWTYDIEVVACNKKIDLSDCWFFIDPALGKREFQIAAITLAQDVAVKLDKMGVGNKILDSLPIL